VEVRRIQLEDATVPEKEVQRFANGFPKKNERKENCKSD